MSDLISRQAAINAVNTALFPKINTAKDAEKALMQIQSKQPERKKGRWIIRDNPGTGWYRVTCSECGEDVTSTIPMIGFFPNAKPLWDYCPWCGAKMEGE